MTCQSLTNTWIALAICITVGLNRCDGEEVSFDSAIRPLLSDKCFHCHGPDEATREADLRLDLREGAFADLGGYSAIVPGEVEESELIHRIESDDPDLVMPPAESKLTLTKREKQLIRDWIRGGAEWSEHWSFVPITPPSVPSDPTGWSLGNIDRFIQRKAAQAGLTPNSQAAKETLIRRLFLDLTGLPPSIEELDECLSDESEHAYENLVDRLLASPSYGQRMAWEWLNAARYADTDGFQGDPTRSMWPWRDWLVNALNQNMPFDQFTIEMLAGDLLPSPSDEQVLATGFNRNHMFNGEGGRIAEETRVENVFDRAETTSTIWLGLTMTCCRCHDHKYDPISQKEYFQFYAFFDNTSETGRSGRGKTAPLLQYLSPDERVRKRELDAQIADVERQLFHPSPELDSGQHNWEKTMGSKLSGAANPSKLGNWMQLGPIALAGRKAFDSDLGPEKEVDLNSSVKHQSWQKAKVIDGKVFALPETVGATFFYRTIQANSQRQMRLSLGSDDAIKVYVNGKEVLSKFAARAAAADQEILDIDLAKGRNELLIKIVNTGGIGGFYFRMDGESMMSLPMDIASALLAPIPKRTQEQKRRLTEYYRSQHWDRWKAIEQSRSRLNRQLKTLTSNAVPVMVMDDLPESKRRRTVILERGGYDKPTDIEVSAGTPAVLPALSAAKTANRLTLARWLVDPENPLMARVTVNRYWQLFFGKGIVTSSEDFGIQGERPTHPDLLDYLATRFIASGWNVKAIHKEIVMSATYRQSATVDSAEYDRDPENKWLARAPRYRLPAWMLRDQALATGGLINRKIGGPAVKPYQPAGIWAEATFGKIKYSQDTGANLYRRSLYTFWRRIVGPTMFFDEAKRQTCEVKPTRTNTPLHALTTLNETLFFEAARSMAQRVLLHSDEDNKRLEFAFRLATSRYP